MAKAETEKVQTVKADGREFQIPASPIKVKALVPMRRNGVMFTPMATTIDPGKLGWSPEQWREFFADGNLQIEGVDKPAVKPSNRGGTIEKEGLGEPDEPPPTRRR